MRCPPEVASILLEILYRSLAQVRCYAADAEYCYLEAEHLLMLPGLIRNYSPSGLVDYWDRDRAAYLENYPRAHRGWVGPVWEGLRPHVEAARRSLPAGRGLAPDRGDIG